MSTTLGLLSIYRDCVLCPENCPEIVNRPRLGQPPRGFWCSQDVQIPLEILVVGKNPGHATPDQPESKSFASVSNDKDNLCEAVMSHAGRLFLGLEPGFHRTMCILGVIFHGPVWRVKLCLRSLDLFLCNPLEVALRT